MKDDELDELLKTTGIGKKFLYPWKFLPEFRVEVQNAPRPVENGALLEIMKRVLDLYERGDGEDQPHFNPPLCKRSVERMKRTIELYGENSDSEDCKRLAESEFHPNPNSLYFLFKRLPIRQDYIKTWLAVEDFRQEMLRLKFDGVFITPSLVLQTMRVIYDDAENNPDQYPGFKFFRCGQAILDIEHALGLQTEDLKYDPNAKVFGSDFKPKRRE